MAYLGQSFDANSVSPDAVFEPLPAGDYLAVIVDSDMKGTKNGAGSYLELVLQVIEGNYANRQIWDRLTLVHPNSKTVEIAQRRLSAICHAVGMLQITDSAQLHNRPMTVRVKVINDAEYGLKNEVTGYKPAGNQPPQSSPVAQPQHVQAAPQTRPAASAPAAAPPWAGGQAHQPAQQNTTPPWAGGPVSQPTPPAAAAAPPWARK